MAKKDALCSQMEQLLPAGATSQTPRPIYLLGHDRNQTVFHTSFHPHSSLTFDTPLTYPQANADSPV